MIQHINKLVHKRFEQKKISKEMIGQFCDHKCKQRYGEHITCQVRHHTLFVITDRSEDKIRIHRDQRIILDQLNALIKSEGWNVQLRTVVFR